MQVLIAGFFCTLTALAGLLTTQQHRYRTQRMLIKCSQTKRILHTVYQYLQPFWNLLIALGK